MESNTKTYYTPKLWEFCDGFEFEILEKGKWELWTYKLGAFLFYVIQNNLKHKNIRVKCLDQHDIESLGFVNVGEYDITSYFQKVKDISEVNPNNLTISFCLEEINPSIEIWVNSKLAYNGKIRNKFHLSQILKDIA